MLRNKLLAVLLVADLVASTSAQEATELPTDSPAIAAKRQFDQALSQWQAATKDLRAKHQQKSKSGDPDGSLTRSIAEVQAQSDALLQQIVAAGLQVYQADPNSFPQVNQTLVSLSGFFVTGDRQGDGGDQYERALPLIKALLDAGAGNQWEELWVLGGVSAYCLQEYELAEEYFDKAALQGLLDNLPQYPSREATIRLRQQAAQWKQELPMMRLRWRKEEGIRQQEAAADDLPRVKFTTSQGDIVIELFENEAPESVANFLSLVKKGYYNGVTFHRVLPMFMAQGGDPEGTGSGGPGYTIRDEHTLPIHRKHFRGSLSMAKTGAPNSGGSQFFLCFVPTSYLDGRHTVFGRVVEGMENAAAIRRRDPESARPAAPDKIISAEVLRDRGHDYEFEKLPERR